ncbi:MAG: helix-turn-helix transcriptional regulator [Paracoccaceae bacterium]|nr:helix-turn-helix transcriptional regulator [Paracoccaceae bacterium]
MADEKDKDWFSEAAATFGDRVAGAREAAAMTQEQLAKRLGVRLKTLQSWEDDLADPRANRLQMMAGMLNVSLKWLLTGAGDGLEAPPAQGAFSERARDALADLSRMRGRMLTLSQDMGHVERRLQALLREGLE